MSLSNTQGMTETLTYPAAPGNNGRIASQTLYGNTTSYQYDSLNRLTFASGNGDRPVTWFTV
jgi:hypothetical protein